jgi:AcrR family transcriptional regulator
MARPRKVSESIILQTARKIFIKYGPGAPTHLIADAVGLSTPALFNHFPTKKALMLAALKSPKTSDWARKIEQGPDDRSLEEQLLEIGTIVQAYFDYVTVNLIILKGSNISTKEYISTHEEPPPVLTIKALSEWFIRAIEKELIKPIDPQTAAKIFLGAIHINSHLDYILPPKRVPYLTDFCQKTFITIFCNGIKDG